MYARLNLRKKMEIRAVGPQTGREVRGSEFFQSKRQVAIATQSICVAVYVGQALPVSMC